MFCTVKTRAKLAAAEIKPLPKRLMKLATNPLNCSLQMFCLKVSKKIVAKYVFVALVRLLVATAAKTKFCERLNKNYT